MAASTSPPSQSMDTFPTISDEEDLDAMFRPPALNLDLPSFIGSSTDATSNSSGLFASSATYLESTQDMDCGGMANSWHATSTNMSAVKESTPSFDWSNCEDWMRWDWDKDVVTSSALPTESSPTSYVNPSLSPTLDSPTSTGVGPSPGSIDKSTEVAAPFVFENIPFEYGFNDPVFAFDNNLQSTLATTETSKREFLNANSFPFEQFQFGAIPDTCPSIPLEYPLRQNLDLGGFNFSEQSLSPASASHRSTSVSSPESSPHSRSRKRKCSVDDEDADTAPTKPKRVVGKKVAHNMVEKKYRMNLNEKIAALRDSIPSLQPIDNNSPGGRNENDEEDVNGESRQTAKPNKGVILSKATEYIRHLERRNRKLNDEMAIMKTRLNAFKTLAMTGSIGLRNGSAVVPDPNSVQGMNANETQHDQVNAQGAYETHNLTRNVRPVGGQGVGGGYLSKLMVASLAGLMMVQGFSEEGAEDTPFGRGLFGLPMQYMGKVRHLLTSMHASNAIGYTSLLKRPLILFKTVLFIGAILYVIWPSFFDAKPREDDKPRPLSGLLLSAAPPLASPLEVRRSAWLTAVQTVWVPRQSFLLQITALVLKFLKLCLRNIIGWHGYAILMGATEDQEAARVRAWEIALDAQLAGGDAEISMSRLILTMIASGTLPETPYRNMLKALHMHVLLREASNSRLGGLYLRRMIASKFAKWQWGRARKFQKKVSSIPPSNEASGCDRLPDYLAMLLELDSDAVMVDAVVQRAYNLAWNKPTSYKVSSPVDGMDDVVDDLAIRSPLDALAAWCSSLILHGVLTNFLEARTSNSNLGTDIRNDLEVALKIAPTASLVQNRILVARAVLFHQNRGANIAAALQALPTLPSQSVGCTLKGVKTASSSIVTWTTPPDLALALRISMACALLGRPQHKKTAIALCEKIRFSPQNLGLLGFIATYYFLDEAFQDKNVAAELRGVLENAAGTLKIWIGGERGKNSGLGKKAKVSAATLCVDVLSWINEMRDE